MITPSSSPTSTLTKLSSLRWTPQRRARWIKWSVVSCRRPYRHYGVGPVGRECGEIASPGAATVPVQNNPPAIFVSNTPAILLNVDGEAKRADIAGTNLGFVVNSNFPLFFEKESPKDYYLFTGEQWFKSTSMEGPWCSGAEIAGGFHQSGERSEVGANEEADSLPFGQGKAAHHVLFDQAGRSHLVPGAAGLRQYSRHPIVLCDQHRRRSLRYDPTKEYYYLAAGRWFQSADLKGPWTYTTPDLPSDFANIPENSPAARVLAYRFPERTKPRMPC